MRKESLYGDNKCANLIFAHAIVLKSYGKNKARMKVSAEAGCVECKMRNVGGRSQARKGTRKRRRKRRKRKTK